MFITFICGSFQNQENGDTSSPACSTPKRSRRSGSYYKNKENKNRYSNLGLDKFNALLTELEEKKQEIYTQNGAEDDIALVQFDISSDNEIKPIVVKVKGQRPSDASSTTSSKTTHDILQVSEQLNKHIENHETSSDIKLDVEEIPKKKRGSPSSHSNKLEKFKQPFYYLPVIVTLVLLFLAIYGRPFAILCTSIVWYLIPLLRGGNKDPASNNDIYNNKRKLKRKKEHSRRLSANIHARNSNVDGSSSPTSVFNGPEVVSPPR